MKSVDEIVLLRLNFSKPSKTLNDYNIPIDRIFRVGNIACMDSELMRPNRSNREFEVELFEALGKLAWVIENHSKAAWPLFDRLEKELDILQSRKSRLDRYR